MKLIYVFCFMLTAAFCFSDDFDDKFSSSDVDVYFYAGYGRTETDYKYSVEDIKRYSGTDYITGDISMLEFDSTLDVIELEFGIVFYERFSVMLDYQESTDSGKDDLLKDTDWLYYYERRRPAIYSEAILDAYFKSFDICLAYKFLPQEDYNFGASFIQASFLFGRLSRNWDFDASHITQKSDIAEFNFTYEGSVIEYHYDMRGYYAGMEFDFLPVKSIVISAGIRYSNGLDVSDKDHHLLRNMISSGRMDADYLKTSVKIEWNFVMKNELRCSFILSGFMERLNAGGASNMTVDGKEYLGQPLDAECKTAGFSTGISIKV